MDFSNYLTILLSRIVGLVGFVAVYKIFEWLAAGMDSADQRKAENHSIAIFLSNPTLDTANPKDTCV